MVHRTIMICLGIFALCLSACSGSATPQLIASYPGIPPGAYPGPLPYNYPPTPAACSAFIEVEVSDLAWATGRARELAASYGASLTGQQTWSTMDHKLALLTLLVPASNLNSLRVRLLDLGTPLRDDLLGNPAYNRLGTCQVSLTLIEKPARLPKINWHPILTLKHALSLSLSIISFLGDAIIWIAVVAGPLVLMGLGLRSLLQRRPKS